MQFTCRALNGLLLLALIISDLNKALYSCSLIGVICKLSIPSLCSLPEEFRGQSTMGCSNMGEPCCSGVNQGLSMYSMLGLGWGWRGGTVNERTWVFCIHTLCRAMLCLWDEAVTDGLKICWTLESNTQHPYADSKPKLWSVCLCVSVSPPMSHCSHGWNAWWSP